MNKQPIYSTLFNKLLYCCDIRVSYIRETNWMCINNDINISLLTDMSAELDITIAIFISIKVQISI